MTTEPQISPLATDLKRELTLFDAVMINAGTMIASAIFIVPASIAAAVPGSAMSTLLNCRGVRLGATTQNVLTSLKIAALLALIVSSFVLPGGAAANFQPLWPSGSVGQWIGPFGVAMVAVLWAYDGWIETTYVGSEIVNPGRNLPRSIILSTLIVIALYVLVSVAYAYVLSPEGMAASQLVASDVAKVTMGGIGATFVVVAILISTLGANNGIILTAARIPYAMARGGMFFRAQGIVHPRYATPTVALLTQCAIASVLTALGRYDQLFTYVVFAQFVFYALSAGAVIKLRRTAPQVPRPYRPWGYPVS